jgi:hypothetical protein
MFDTYTLTLLAIGRLYGMFLPVHCLWKDEGQTPRPEHGYLRHGQLRRESKFAGRDLMRCVTDAFPTISAPYGPP